MLEHIELSVDNITVSTPPSARHVDHAQGNRRAYSQNVQLINHFALDLTDISHQMPTDFACARSA
jgi:hypothetical protein